MTIIGFILQTAGAAVTLWFAIRARENKDHFLVAAYTTLWVLHMTSLIKEVWLA